MHTKEEITTELEKALVELFEIDAEIIQPNASLNEDLDIDSIDAIDLVMHFKEQYGKRMEPESFKSVRTVQDVVDAVYEELKV